MWQETSEQLRAELKTASAEYLEAKIAFVEVLDEMRLVNPADAGSLLRLAIDAYNRAFERHRQAEHLYEAFVIQDKIPWMPMP